MISGDTARVENMVRFSRGADVLVHEALNRDMVEMLAKALDASGNARAGTRARQVIAYHTSPVEAAAIAKEAGVPLLHTRSAAAQERADAQDVHARGEGGAGAG